jgi:hypothetical protein
MSRGHAKWARSRRQGCVYRSLRTGLFPPPVSAALPSAGFGPHGRGDLHSSDNAAQLLARATSSPQFRDCASAISRAGGGPHPWRSLWPW